MSTEAERRALRKQKALAKSRELIQGGRAAPGQLRRLSTETLQNAQTGMASGGEKSRRITNILSNRAKDFNPGVR